MVFFTVFSAFIRVCCDQSFFYISSAPILLGFDSLFKKTVFCALFVLLSAQMVLGAVQVLSPVEAGLTNGSSIQAGSVSPGQVFELIFSDNSGLGFEWDRVAVDNASLPAGWTIVSTQAIDPALIVRIKVPTTAQPNFYVLNLLFSNSDNPSVQESVNVRLVVKQDLLNVSFARQTPEGFSVVGSDVLYKAVITNSSIAPHNLKVSSTLPNTWFEGRSLVVKPNSVEELDLVVSPQVYGKDVFSFYAESLDQGVVVESFSSELNIRPTLKGKFGSAFNGFPFFTFSLVPFQLADSFLSFIFQN